MLISELNNATINPTLPTGENTITVTGFRYRVNPEGHATGCDIEVKDYKPIYLHIFEELADNWNLEQFVKQLGIETYNELAINEAIGNGKKVKVYREKAKQGDYINSNFNPKASAKKSLTL